MYSGIEIICGGTINVNSASRNKTFRPLNLNRAKPYPVIAQLIVCNNELKKGDIVAVEANPGHDIGVVTLTGTNSDSEKEYTLSGLPQKASPDHTGEESYESYILSDTFHELPYNDIDTLDRSQE